MTMTDRQARRAVERRLAKLNPSRAVRAYRQAGRIAGNFEHPAHLAAALSVAVVAAIAVALR